jgi:hypothetical protein
MHFEILIEDRSGKEALDILMPKIIGVTHTFKVYAYKGIGRIPKGLRTRDDASKRILLEQLPRLLRGYGNAFAGFPGSYPAAVVVVCDLDDRCLKTFRQELLTVLEGCRPKPETRFCFAIEEGEAWFLGDINAIKRAYPKVDDKIINNYRNDSICSTWELLADAIFPGGSRALSAKGWQAIGAEKAAWSREITPYMDMENNTSPSFNYFRTRILELARATSPQRQ